MNLEINNKKLENVKNHGFGSKEIRKCLNMNENKNTCGTAEAVARENIH